MLRALNIRVNDSDNSETSYCPGKIAKQKIEARANQIRRDEEARGLYAKDLKGIGDHLSSWASKKAAEAYLAVSDISLSALKNTFAATMSGVAAQERNAEAAGAR